MPPKLGTDDNAASSTAHHYDDQAASSPADGANEQLESPTSEQVDHVESESNEEEDFLAAITEAAEGDDDVDDTESDDEKSDEEDADDKEESDEDSETDEATDQASPAEDDAKAEGENPPPFHKHPRWQEMVRDRDSLKEKVDALTPRAEDYGKIEQFMQHNELTVQDVAEGLQVVALMKNDPVRARAVLAERMQRLDQFTGDRLPDDLQAEVNEGVISEGRAKELAQLRSQTDFVTKRSERQQQKSEEARRQDEARQVIQDQQSAVRKWEADIQKTDPDYKRIQRFVTKELRLLVQQAPPMNTEQAVALAKQAYETVKGELRAVMPEKPAVSRGPNSQQSGSSQQTGQEPASFMDAITQAANKS